jgi:GT2 family glycosyltransferase
MFQTEAGRVNSLGIRVDPSGMAWDVGLGDLAWPAEPVEVFGASGGACLLRRAMLEDVGLFAEPFFAYYEDVDLAWRARLRGWTALLAPAAVVHHAHSATGGEGSSFKQHLLARNRIWTTVRNYPARPLLAHLPLVLAYHLLPVAHGLVHRDVTPLRGRLDALAALPRVLRERRAIQSCRTASWEELRSAMGPIEGPLATLRRAGLAPRWAARPS